MGRDSFSRFTHIFWYYTPLAWLNCILSANWFLPAPFSLSIVSVKSFNQPHFPGSIIKRPGVAEAVLQTPLSFMKWLSHSSFVKISSEHLHSQTRRARELKFWKKVHLPPTPSGVICHMSHVMCQVSHVMCHMCFFLSSSFSDKGVNIVGGGSVISGAYPI